MLVWLASFPRSGNTYLRILLNSRYGLRTSVVYDVDGVAERLGADSTGAIARPASLDAMRDAPEPHFIKTHRQRDGDVHPDDRAICLVRDGRSALVSWARPVTESDPSLFETRLQGMIMRTGEVGTGSWGRNVLGWLRPPAPHRGTCTSCSGHGPTTSPRWSCSAGSPPAQPIGWAGTDRMGGSTVWTWASTTRR